MVWRRRWSQAEPGDTPMRIALLVDNGDRIYETNANNPLRSGLNAFLETLPPQHEISLFTIARNLQRRVDFTADRDELKDGVGLINATSRSSAVLLDGLKETWERRFEDDVGIPGLRPGADGWIGREPQLQRR